MTWPRDAKVIPGWEPIPDMPGHYQSTKPIPPLERPTKLINEVLKKSQCSR
jgi:hypothetical protein